MYPRLQDEQKVLYEKIQKRKELAKEEKKKQKKDKKSKEAAKEKTNGIITVSLP